jgi:hypothetical protein
LGGVFMRGGTLPAPAIVVNAIIVPAMGRCGQAGRADGRFDPPLVGFGQDAAQVPGDLVGFAVT